MSSGATVRRFLFARAAILRGIVFGAALCRPLLAQQLVFEEFGFDRGLANSAVNCLLEDSRGFLWVGTMSGLYRGNGERFEKFGESAGLPDETIQSLLEDGRGRLWVATRRGVAWWDKGRFHAAAFPRPVQIFGRRALAAGRDGRLYVAAEQGLFSAPAGGSRFEPYPLPDPPGRSPVDAVFAAPDGTLWLSARKTLWKLSSGRTEQWGPVRGVPVSRWDDFLADRDGSLWVRGADALIVLRPGAAAFENSTGPLPASGFFGSLAIDHEGRLIVPTDNGLFVRDGSGWRRYGVAEGLPGQSVSVALHDSEGSFWIGLWGLGLLRVAGYGLTESWTVQDGLASSTVSAILEDSRGGIWAGTDDGIAILVRGSRRWKKWQNGNLCGTKIRALVMGPDLSVWAGCFPGGVSRIPPSGPAQTLRQPGAPMPDRVNGLLVDAQGHLWVASLEGLFRSRHPAGGKEVVLERLQPPESPSGEAYFRMAAGADGAIWIAASGGLVRWKAGQWTRYGPSQGLRDAAVTHVALGQDGTVWVGYRRPLGVSRLRPDGGVEHFVESLASPTPLLVRSDRAGRVWIGGDNGLDVTDGAQWSRFTKADGLGAYSCAVDAFLAASDGSVWIGTSRGITRLLRPDEALSSPRRAIPLAVAWIQAGERRFTHWQEGAVEAAAPGRSFAAGLAALTFRYRSGLRFHYRLLGSHENWVESDSPEVRYSSLPPGRYVFEARAVSTRAGLAASELRIPVVIPTPFHMTWWFRMLLVAAAAGALRAAWAWRIRAMKQRQRWLEDAVRERTRQLHAEKERADEALRRAEQASRFKSEFLARMSHEIRTPMHGVIGTADLLLRTPLSPDQQELVRTLKESAAVLMNLLNDVLDLSRIEAGKLALAAQPFQLSAVARTVTALMRPMAAARGIELRLTAPEAPLWFLGDAHRVQQILLNLVSNAVKFTERGFVEISVRAPADSSGVGFEIVVQDTGRGIPPEKLESIFQPFVQIASGPPEETAGTGLGLSITKALVDAMGGSIHVESTPGSGSVFRVLLPLPAAEPPRQEEPESGREEASAKAPLRVLLVEDHPINQRMVARMLEALGHEAEVVADGESAVAHALEGRFDVILIDIRLPGIDGLETARRLRAAGCRTPLIALSANVYESDRAAAREAGMDSFLGKPLHLEELREALALLAHRRSGG
ncbi:MAG: ATP-binding protein [Bryobacteraceae bacterium]|nr:ATP-binding protein [Bryobacteraceae bacterium]